MLLEPADIDWRNADDSAVYYAARDGVPQAQAELQRREAQQARGAAVEAARQSGRA